MRSFLVIFLCAVALSSCTSDAEKHLAQSLVAYDEHKYDELSVSGEMSGGVRIIHVTADALAFEPDTIIVNKGEKVRLMIQVLDVPHGFEIEGFTIPGYDINTKIRKGSPLTLEFVADEMGVWPFICTIYCGYGHSEMKGVFVIR
jgi:cytochrome c oxidase subunit II